MDIAVCIKQVPASESKIQPRCDGCDIERAGIAYVVNPYDEFAIEEALRIKEKFKCGEVTVITLGPIKSVEALRTCLAIGADRAEHIQGALGMDIYEVAVVLAAALRRVPYSLILFGKQAIDDDQGATGIAVAALLGLPHVSVVNHLEVGETSAICHRQIEGAIEIIETPLPAVVTCQKGLNEPRYATLPGILRAKQKPITTLSYADLGLSGADDVMRKTAIQRMEMPPARPSGKIISGSPDEAVAELVQCLRNEIHIL